MQPNALVNVNPRFLTLIVLLFGGSVVAQDDAIAPETQTPAVASPAEPATDGTPPQPIPSESDVLVEDPNAFVLDRFEALSTYQGYLRNGDFEQAVDVAEVAVTLTEDDLGAFDMALVPILTDLGTALIQSGRPAEAVPHLERSVNIVEERVGIFSADLVRPLYGMGLAMQSLGNHEGAIGNLQRAQHVTHRVNGVVNLDQIPIIQALARSHMAQDKWTEAENLQLLTYKIHRRNFGKESVETLPAMYDLANWYHDIQDQRQARIIYRRGLEILEEAGLDETPAAVPAHKGIARAYLAGHHPDVWSKGLSHQEEIVDIVDRHADEVSLDEQVVAHLELGDWYVLVDDEKRAWEQYRIGWELAQQADHGDRDWEALFQRPHLIHPGGNLHVDFMGYQVVGKEVYYDFRFTITPTGKPSEIEILGSNLHGQTRAAAVHMFRLARFRPRIVDGVTVATEGYKIRKVYPTEPPDDYGINIGQRGG